MSLREHVYEKGEETKNYFNALKKLLVERGLFETECNLFPDDHRICVQMRKNTATPLAYQDKKFITDFKAFLKHLFCTDVFKPKVESCDLNIYVMFNNIPIQIFEYQEIFDKLRSYQ